MSIKWLTANWRICDLCCAFTFNSIHRVCERFCAQFKGRWKMAHVARTLALRVLLNEFAQVVSVRSKYFIQLQHTEHKLTRSAVSLFTQWWCYAVYVSSIRTGLCSAIYVLVKGKVKICRHAVELLERFFIPSIAVHEHVLGPCRVLFRTSYQGV